MNYWKEVKQQLEQDLKKKICQKQTERGEKRLQGKVFKGKAEIKMEN